MAKNIQTFTVAELLEKVKDESGDDNVMWELSYGNEIAGMHVWTDSDKLKAAKGRMLEKPLLTWICTDTEVGYHVIVLDGEPIAITRQHYRKSDREWDFIGKEGFEKFRNFYYSLAQDPTGMTILDPTGSFEIDRGPYDDADFYHRNPSPWSFSRPTKNNL